MWQKIKALKHYHQHTVLRCRIVFVDVAFPLMEDMIDKLCLPSNSKLTSDKCGALLFTHNVVVWTIHMKIWAVVITKITIS